MLSRIDLEELSYELRHKANNETSKQRKTEALKRLQVVEAFREGNLNRQNLPEWMVMKAIPVIPPEPSIDDTVPDAPVPPEPLTVIVSPTE